MHISVCSVRDSEILKFQQLSYKDVSVTIELACRVFRGVMFALFNVIIFFYGDTNAHHSTFKLFGLRP